jgi:hypothetical protein
MSKSNSSESSSYHESKNTLGFTHVDNFCLIFFGAWLSTEQKLWNDYVVDLGFIIIGLFCFIIFLQEFRALIYQKTFTNKFFYAILGIIVFFGLTLFKYYIINDENYNNAYKVFLVVGIIWVLLSVSNFRFKQYKIVEVGDHNEADV